MIENAGSRGVSQLFVTLEVSDEAVQHAAKLRRFVAMAHEAGVRVEAVEGDPRMVLADGLEAALRRARAFARYQRSASAEERLGGIQYDIEPYILASWTGDAADYRAWSDAVLRLAEASTGGIDLVVPFWIASTSQGEAFLERVAPVTRGLTVMSYRTDAAVLSQIAEPLLAWGSARGKPIRLALEAGPLADEVDEVYRPAANGTLALVDGPPPRLMQMDQPGVVPDARMYRLSHRITIRGADLSFQGQEDAMASLAAETGPTFQAWPAFSGFALHGLSWTVSERLSAGGH